MIKALERFECEGVQLQVLLPLEREKNMREHDSYISNNGWCMGKNIRPLYFLLQEKEGNMFSKSIYFNQFKIYYFSVEHGVICRGYYTGYCTTQRMLRCIA